MLHIINMANGNFKLTSERRCENVLLAVGLTMGPFNGPRRFRVRKTTSSINSKTHRQRVIVELTCNRNNADVPLSWQNKKAAVLCALACGKGTMKHKVNSANWQYTLFGPECVEFFASLYVYCVYWVCSRVRDMYFVVVGLCVSFARQRDIDFFTLCTHFVEHWLFV